MAYTPLFPPPDIEVTKQVELRQFFMGDREDITNNSEVQNWKFNNSAWIRLASTVNLELPKTDASGSIIPNGTTRILDAIGIDSNNYNNYCGSKLAEACVLYNGVSKINTFNDAEGTPSVETLLRSLTPEANYFQDIPYTNNPDYSPINDFTYGFGGNIQGIRPQPGIKSVNVGYINRGTNAKITVEIIAFNREQLAIIDALYCHPGYNMLLEWGHTSYIDNTSQLITIQPNSNTTLPLTKLFSGNRFTIREMYNLIQGTARGRSGNYEGFFGPVSNFSYKFNADGTYSITITLISMGAVAESFKMNIPSAQYKGNAGLNDVTSELEEQRNNLINQFIIDWCANEEAKSKKEAIKAIKVTPDELQFYQRHRGPNDAEGITKLYYYDSFDPANYEWDGHKVVLKEGATNRQIMAGQEFTSATFDFTNMDANGNPTPDAAQLEKDLDLLNEAPEDDITDAAAIRFSNLLAFWMSVEQESLNAAYKATPEDIIIQKPLNYYTCRINWKEDSGKSGFKVQGDQVVPADPQPGSDSYVRLGSLVSFINDNLVIRGDDGAKLIKIYSSTSNNKCSRTNLTISSDPTICIVDNSTYNILPKLKEYYNGFEINSTTGRLLNVWVNVDFVAVTSAAYADNKGNVSLIAFLNHLLKGISDALGGINEFEVSYDNLDNEVHIRELIYANTRSIPQDPIVPEFNIFGLEPNNRGFNEGSFVESVDFTTQISSDLAALSVVSAKSGGADPLAAESTPFAQYNEGLTDRSFPNKKTSLSAATPAAAIPTVHMAKEIEEVKKIMVELYTNLKFDHSKTPTLRAALTAALQYTVNYEKNNKGRPSSFLLPFNLSLSMMGMGGFRLFDRFSTTNKILPPTFDKLDFIIKSISHSITANKWTTKIESMAGQSIGNFSTDNLIDYGALPQPPSPPGKNGNLDSSELTTLRSLGLNFSGAGNRLSHAAAADFAVMYKDMPQNVKDDLALTDGYRSYEVQYEKFDWDLYIATGGSKDDTRAKPGATRAKVGTNGGVKIAFPGTSNHGWGNAIDIGGSYVREWMRLNGFKYNWSWYEGALDSVKEVWHFTWTTDSDKHQVYNPEWFQKKGGNGVTL